MKAWAGQHARSFSSTLAKLVRTPLGSLFNIMVIGIALCLPVGLYVLIDNLQMASGNWPRNRKSAPSWRWTQAAPKSARSKRASSKTHGCWAPGSCRATRPCRNSNNPAD